VLDRPRRRVRAEQPDATISAAVAVTCGAAIDVPM
jgi:hypothetical protein